MTNLCFFKILIALVFTTFVTSTYGQHSTNVSGRQANGSEGSVSYSIRQIDYKSLTDKATLISAGNTITTD